VTELTAEFKDKINKLSFLSFYVENTDDNSLIGIAEVILSFSRDEVTNICDELFLFTIWGLGKKGLATEIVDFVDEYSSSGKFNYRKGITSAIRFVHFSNYYMRKFIKDFVDSPFVIGNTFIKEQVELCRTLAI